MRRLFQGASLLTTIGVLTVLAGAGSAATARTPTAGAAPTPEPSMRCSGDLAASTRQPVLLLPGTTQTPETNFSWNYEPALTSAGVPWCSVTLPENAMGDAQTAGEHVAGAVRAVHGQSGKKVQIVGFSQGGMLPRWALKFWPDTQPMVDDVISLDGSNHGTLDAYPVCLPGCAPAFWQQQTGSRFLGVLNAGRETVDGISYTQAYTLTDEVVFPNLGPAGSSSLRPESPEVANIAVQDVCPVHVADHLSMGTIDPVGHALVDDALSHPGPADPARIDRSVCTRLLMPGVDPAKFPLHFAGFGTTVADQVLFADRVPAEPPLKPYARP